MGDLTEFKEAQREAWADGDYPAIGRVIKPAALHLVQAAAVQRGQRVLDVGVGSGSVTVAAAGTGADVVGVDIIDTWFPVARERAAAFNIELDLRIGDAEELPFGDNSFDVVLSSFAAIFAPRHDLVAAELVRVCRPGGTIGLTAWTPDGAGMSVLSPVTGGLPPPPDEVMPSVLWGDPDHVRSLFFPHPVTTRFDLASFTVHFDSPGAYEMFIFENSGPLASARQGLIDAGRWDDVRAAMHAAMAETNQADDGSYQAPWEYLLIVAAKRA